MILAAPSCLGGHNHQEKQVNPPAKHEHQVPLDAITQAMYLDSLPISQRWWIYDGDEWECNRTDQFIRAQVRKQSLEWSNRHTWTHINPIVNWNHEGFQTNLHTTKIIVIQHNKPHVTSISQVVHKYHIHWSSHSYYNTSSQIAKAK